MFEDINTNPNSGLLRDRQEFVKYRELPPDEKTAAPVPQSENPDEDAKTFNHYIADNTIISVKNRGRNNAAQRISNFAFSLLYKFDNGNGNSIHLAKYTNANTGESGTLEITTEELTNLQTFKKVFSEKGCIFNGISADLEYIKERLFLMEQTARKIDILGQDTESDIYIFANGILKTGEFYPVNKLGLIQTEELLYLPYFAEANKESKKYENSRKFVYTGNPQTNTAKIFDLLQKAYGHNGTICTLYTAAALFRDLIIKKLGFFPYLFVFGEAGTGKTTLINFLLSFFGKDIQGVSVSGGSSTKGIARSFSQRRNGVIYLKEYTNNIDKEFDSLLKVVYDGQTYTTAQTDNSNETNTRAVNSAIIIDGNELPTNNDAVFSRVILAELRNTIFTEEQTAAKNELEELQENTFTDVTRQLLTLRPVIEKEFEKVFTSCKNEIRIYTNGGENELTDRTKNHCALLLAIYDILQSNNIQLPMTRNDFVFQLIQNSVEKEKEVKQTRATTVFWEKVSYIIDTTPETAKLYYYREKDNILIVNIDGFLHYVYRLPNREKLGDTGTLKKLLRGNNYKPYKPNKTQKDERCSAVKKYEHYGNLQQIQIKGYGFKLEIEQTESGNIYYIDGVQMPNKIVEYGEYINKPYTNNCNVSN